MEDTLATFVDLDPDYEEKFKLYDGIEVRFIDVGHLLGSASIEVWVTEDGVCRK